MQCKICGKNPCYERNGRVFALCASCIWKALQELLDLPDPRSPTLRAVVQSEQTESYTVCTICGKKDGEHDQSIHVAYERSLSNRSDGD